MTVMYNHSQLRIGPKHLVGELTTVRGAPGTVIFAHGSGSGRWSPRNQRVAQMLQHESINTLLLDLLTPEEAEDRQNVFNIDLLVQRLMQAIDALPGPLRTQPVGLFGASTGAAAALLAAAQRPDEVVAVVSRGGRPDLAGDALSLVRAATLLIVGGADTEVLALNRQAYQQLRCEKRIEVIPRATHLFQEAGALDAVAHGAADWFGQHLKHKPAQA